MFAWVVYRIVAYFGIGLYIGSGWTAAIGFESVWILTAILCSFVMPSGVVHNITWKSTMEGVLLCWPEVIYTLYVLFIVLTTMPIKHGIIGPTSFALSVGAGEEIIFRMLLLGWLLTKLDSARTVLIGGLVFGLAHLQEPSLLGLVSIIPQTSGGILYGAIYLRTRNPLGPILCHAFWDLPYFLGWGLISGGSTEAGFPSVGSIMFWTSFGLYGLFILRNHVTPPNPVRARSTSAMLRPAQT